MLHREWRLNTEKMGYSIKNKNGGWNAKSSISGEWLLDEDGTEEDLKKAFMEIAIQKMVEKLIEIEMEFPNKYTLNGRLHIDKSKPSFNEWYLDILRENNDESWERFKNKYNEIKEKYDLYV